jgi:ABC-type branched-subunit amino acid transport system substrate-binding protein
MKNFLFIFLFLGILASSLSAQDLNDYNRAKKLIEYGNYSEAMEVLRPFMDSGKYGNLANYASYHFSWAAYQNGQYLLVESVLKDRLHSNNWRDKDAGRLLLALAYFQEGRNVDALELIALIKNPEVIKEAENASYNFLKDASVSFLTRNMRKFNDNKGYMLALRNQIEKQAVMSSEEQAIYNQIKNIDLGMEGGNIIPQKNNATLDIAVILPFNYSGGKGVDNLGSNNFIFELYQGLNFAFENLKASGTPINLKTFDTERNPSKVRGILEDSFLLQADVIIGPVYPEESEIVVSFAENNDIPYINPLSNINDRFDGFNHAYLFRPSVNSLADGIMDYSRKNFVGRKLAIAYSNAARDEQLAQALKQRASNLGFSIIKEQQVNSRTVIDFLENVKLKSGDKAEADIVIILSDDPNLAAPTFGFVESQNISKPIIVMDSWLFFNFANYEMLEEQNFYFVGNNALDFQNPRLFEFRELFNTKYSGYPSFNAHLGYEMMHWIAKNINPQVGFDIRKNLNQIDFQTGTLTFGFNFRNSNFNNFVPVLKLENGVVVGQ